MPHSKKGKCFLCGATSTSRCVHCRQVFYCSKEHFAFHHQREYCFPFKIDWNPLGGGGFCAIATRNIRPLELILFDWNIISGPEFASKRASCPGCNRDVKEENFKDICCPKCGVPMCSVNPPCPNKNIHSLECAMLKTNSLCSISIPPDELNLIILALRLIKASSLSPKTAARLKILKDQKAPDQNEAKKDELWAKKKTDIMNVVMNKVSVQPILQETLSWILDLIRTHCINLKTSVGIQQGVAVFPIFSLFQHSCIRNSKFVVYPNNTLAVLAQTMIPMGEEITISLVNTMEPTWKRRARLYRDHLILCYCRRCRDPTELGSFLGAAKCDKCDKVTEQLEHSKILPSNPVDPNTTWSCPVHTGIRMPSESIQQLAIDMQVQLTMLDKNTAASYQEYEKFLRECEMFFHPWHALMIKIKMSLLAAYNKESSNKALKRNILMSAKKLSQELTHVISKIEPGYPDMKGNIINHYSTAELNLARLDLQEQRIARPEFLLRVRKAMVMVQEATRCKSCVRIDRSLQQMSVDLIAEEMSADSSYLSDASCASVCENFLDL